MRYSLVFASLAFCVATTAWAQDETTETPTENQSKESVEFDGETLTLAWEGGVPTDPIKEYIPADQDLETWTKLASIRIHSDLNDPEQIVAAVASELKKQNPRYPSDYQVDPETGAVVIEFVMWPGEGVAGEADFVEYNVFKYERRPEGGLVAQQYALRAYRGDVVDFLRGLDPVKKRLRELMAKKGLKLIEANSEEDAKSDDDETSDDE